MTGKSVTEIPTAVQEFIMACIFGWSLDEIRSMTERDFKTLFPMAMNKFVLDCYKSSSIF